jgi:hypothetical protein
VTSTVAAVSLASLKSLSSIEVAADNPLVLSHVSLQAQQFQFAFPTTLGLTYEVQYKESLSSPDWVPFMTNTGTGEWLTNDVPATNGASSFFRVIIK